MKLAAVLVPLGFLILPTVFMVFHIVISAAMGKDVEQVTYPTGSLRHSRFRLLIYLLVSLYMLAFIASVAWAIYVFTDEALVSIFIGGSTVIVILFSVWLSVFTKRLPKSPAEGFQSELDYSDWLNKRSDALRKTLVKPLIKTLLWAFVLPMALFIPLSIVLLLLRLLEWKRMFQWQQYSGKGRISHSLRIHPLTTAERIYMVPTLPSYLIKELPASAWVEQSALCRVIPGFSADDSVWRRVGVYIRARVSYVGLYIHPFIHHPYARSPTDPQGNLASTHLD